jgi:fatty-acyl-CoA synthase
VDVRVAEDEGPLGRIRVRGPSLLTQYSGTRRAAFDDDGYLDTGDVGFCSHGELHVVGRSDDVIIIGGRNLYPADIESAVAVALSIPTRSVAAIATDRGYELIVERRGALKRTPEREARSAVSAAVDPIGANPSSVSFVAPGEMQRTPNGKLRRNSVADSELTYPRSIRRE